MFEVKENVSLKPFNTFGIDVNAKYFRSIESEEQLHELMQTDLFKNERRIVLGGGSNFLFTHDFNGVILYNCILRNEKKGEKELNISIRCLFRVNLHQI